MQLPRFQSGILWGPPSQEDGHREHADGRSPAWQQGIFNPEAIQGAKNDQTQLTKDLTVPFLQLNPEQIDEKLIRSQ